MRKLKTLLRELTETAIHISVTRWFKFVFEFNWWSPEYAFHCTLFGIGLRLPFFEFVFRVLQDGHKDAEFYPITMFTFELGKFRILTNRYYFRVEKAPANFEAGIYLPDEEIKARNCFDFRWGTKTLGSWIPFKPKGWRKRIYV